LKGKQSFRISRHTRTGNLVWRRRPSRAREGLVSALVYVSALYMHTRPLVYAYQTTGFPHGQSNQWTITSQK